MTDRTLTSADINHYVQHAHQLRAEATRDVARAAATWVRSLFAGRTRTA